jgi:quinol monooxygenase YgiN
VLRAPALIRETPSRAEGNSSFKHVLHSFVKPSRAEPACVDYHLHVSNDDPNLFVFYENWRTRKELDEHPQTPILNSFWSRRFDLLQRDVDIQFITMLTDPDKISIAGTSRKRESQIILKTDERSIHLDLGREPKFNRLRRAGDPLQRHTAAARSN